MGRGQGRRPASGPRGAALSVIVLGLLAGAAAAGAPYVPYSGILHGTEGTEPVLLEVANETGAPLACAAALAHWYSETLGTAPPGGQIAAALRRDPATGVVSLMNAAGARMPVEALWCGAEGRVWETRARLRLPEAGGRAAFRCAEAGGRIACAGPGGEAGGG